MNETLRTYVENQIFSFTVSNLSSNIEKNAFHLDYQEKIYRQKDLVRLIRDVVPYFALTENEYNDYISEGNTIDLKRDAWSRISKARKDKKGDYGELLLYLILLVHYNSPKFVTKIRLRSSQGDQIKGFDCAHFTFKDNEPCLWLGEAKFYQSFSDALNNAIESVNEHLEYSYLESEMSILKSNIKLENEANYKKLQKIFQGLSLDKIKFKIPILLTYDSNTVKNNTDVNLKFKEELKEELIKHNKAIEGKNITKRPNIDFVFILFPLYTVKDIKDKLDIIEGLSR